MDDVIIHGLLKALEWHSITHSLTHSILINLFIKVRLNTLLIPPLLSITFLPSAFYAYIWHILEGTSKACIFSRHINYRDGFCINGNILKNTDNIICKKWTWNCWKDIEIIERGSLLYIWTNCAHLFPILLDMEKMRSTGVWKNYRAWRWDFVQRKANKPKSLIITAKKRSSNC